MSVILILIAVSLALAAGFLGCFVWAVRSGQYEDTCTPALRILTDEESTLPYERNSISSTNTRPARTEPGQDRNLQV